MHFNYRTVCVCLPVEAVGLGGEEFRDFVQKVCFFMEVRYLGVERNGLWADVYVDPEGRPWTSIQEDELRRIVVVAFKKHPTRSTRGEPRALPLRRLAG